MNIRNAIAVGICKYIHKHGHWTNVIISFRSSFHRSEINMLLAMDGVRPAPCRKCNVDPLLHHTGRPTMASLVMRRRNSSSKLCWASRARTYFLWCSSASQCPFRTHQSSRGPSHLPRSVAAIIALTLTTYPCLPRFSPVLAKDMYLQLNAREKHL